MWPRRLRLSKGSLTAGQKSAEGISGHDFGKTSIYVRSERAGKRVMESITQFITQKLKLKVNEAKSAVARPQERKFLGFSFIAGPEVKRVIAPKALDRFKQRIREITQRANGVSMETTMEELARSMRGWRSYFCETPEVLIGLTRWIRLRLRAAMWRQWKTPRRRRAARLELGVRPRLASNTAGSRLGPWYLAKAKALSVGFPMRTSNRLGFRHCLRKCRPNHLEPPYTDQYVRWCGRGRRVAAAPMPIWRATRKAGVAGCRVRHQRGSWRSSGPDLNRLRSLAEESTLVL